MPPAPRANPPELLGRWRLEHATKKNGEAFPTLPAHAAIVYELGPEGRGVVHTGPMQLPMRWHVEEGRLVFLVTTPKSRDSSPYELREPDTLVLTDRHGGRNTFKRLP